MGKTTETETICIDETDKTKERFKEMVTTNSLKSGDTGPVITIKAPKGKKIKFIGTEDPILDDKNDAYTLVTRLSDDDDIVIDFMTKIIIAHKKFNYTVVISKLFYCDINTIYDSSLYEDPDLKKKVTFYNLKNETMWYRFKNTVILDEEEKLIISVISPNRNIEKIKFAIWAEIENIKYDDMTHMQIKEQNDVEH
jgi:hypothetical protein